MKIHFNKQNLPSDGYRGINGFRGVFALMVVLSHIWGYTGAGILVPFNKVVTIVVALFFFCSGYGLMYSLDHKEGYLRKIWTQKIPQLLWKALVVYLLSVLIEVLVIAPGIPLQDYLENREITSFLPVSVSGFVLTTNWYILELTAFYALFALIMQWVPKKWRVWCIEAVLLALFVGLYYSAFVEAVYDSIAGFALGIACGAGLYENWQKKNPLSVWAVIVLLLGITVYAFVFMAKDTILFSAIRNFAAIGVILLLLKVFGRVRVESGLLRLLSGISAELYFCHIPAAYFLSGLAGETWLYAGAVLAVSVASAVLMKAAFGAADKLKKMLR